MNLKLIPLAVAALLVGCSASDVLTVATVAIEGEVAGAAASGWQPGVVYGDAALGGVSCIGAEFNSADAVAVKYTKYTACVVAAEASVPTGNASQMAIVAGIDAALNALLIAEGAQPVPVTASRPIKAVAVAGVKVKQYDGQPPWLVRRDVESAIGKAKAAKK
jgi:hypothetical protein